MQKEYKYFAFISFQSGDAREAVRLQHAIERYRLPAVLCKQDKSLPRRIKPLYCYLNDIHAGEELMQELKSRMEQSRYLIVVCSPRAAQSTYINSGIDYFVSLGHRDSIIPIIIDGVPYSGDTHTECFPEALRRHFPRHADPLQDRSILGVNTHEAGIRSRRKAYDRAMLMVVARMLQLDFDGLLLREKQRRRKRAVLWSLLALVVSAALSLTWHFAQTVDVGIRVEEGSAVNNMLPPCKQIAIQLQLDNEIKSDTLAEVGQTLLFRNIPPQFIGKDVQICLRAAGFKPCDTTVVLERQMTLPLYRDEDLYGNVHFRLVGIAHPERQKLSIGGHETTPDSEGLINLHIPVENQQTVYAVTVNGITDSIYMPCGEDDIIVVAP
ncbi:MAG: toll/interleukin-1 receptor domain-containing protein [Paludibacteraceae bacterium]|nr:toll/interleukin-1 receptor domain-containing protein [Paludibacteraceae bacterium]